MGEVPRLSIQFLIVKTVILRTLTAQITMTSYIGQKLGVLLHRQLKQFHCQY